MTAITRGVHQDLWTPPDLGDDLVLIVGKWWDAVSTPTALGNRALELLGTSGAVIQDDAHGKLYWLIGADTARSWCLRGVRVLTMLVDESTFLTVPPASWTDEGRDLYWRVPVGPGRYLTNAHRLHESLAQAIDESHDHAAEGPTCPSRPGDATLHRTAWWMAYRYLGGAS